jgi:o-succinylbenzoate synthase
VQWYHYQIPLHSTFTTAHETLGTREGVIIEVCTNDALSGIGECAPLPTFTRMPGDTLQDAIAALKQIKPQLLSQTIAEALHVVHKQGKLLPPTASFALETALLDLLGQQSGTPLNQLIAQHTAQNNSGAVHPQQRHSIPVNAVIGARTLDDTVTQALLAVKQGFRCLKLKIGTGAFSIEQEVARIGAVRAAVGPDIQLRLDANESLNVAQATTLLTRCAHYQLQYVEQPLPRAQLAEMRHLRAQVTVPLAADEAVTTLQSARQILAEQAADILIIKPQLLGGLLIGRQIIQSAAEQQVQCVITSSIDTGIGIAAALHLAAASPEVTLACGLATFTMLENDLLSEPLHSAQGMLTVPAGPGLGVHCDHLALKRYSQRIS